MENGQAARIHRVSDRTCKCCVLHSRVVTSEHKVRALALQYRSHALYPQILRELLNREQVLWLLRKSMTSPNSHQPHSFLQVSTSILHGNTNCTAFTLLCMT
ncbi:uncharacterized protein LJ206_004839 isoform 3-T3 [Theristicus caerulescens]